MFLLKFIFFVFLFIFVIGIIAVLFLRLAAKKLLNNFNKQFGQKANETEINNPTQKSKKESTYINKGEYVDFEEIK